MPGKEFSEMADEPHKGRDSSRQVEGPTGETGAGCGPLLCQGTRKALSWISFLSRERGFNVHNSQALT